MKITQIAGALILVAILAATFYSAAKAIGWRSAMKAFFGGLGTAGLALLAGWLIAGGAP
jgi:hypothetical protein